MTSSLVFGYTRRFDHSFGYEYLRCLPSWDLLRMRILGILDREDEYLSEKLNTSHWTQIKKGHVPPITEVEYLSLDSLD